MPKVSSYELKFHFWSIFLWKYILMDQLDVIVNVHLIHLVLLFPTYGAKSRFIFAKYSFMLNLAFKQFFC
jgi:hypothetical protein